MPLTVSSCASKTISEIIKGHYVTHAENHGKVVYKKSEKSKGLDVLIYYWDERDGPELCGWWFGPVIGGDQVWAYHPSRQAATPPASEWNVPHDGAIDPTFTVTANRSGVAKRAAEPAKESQKASKDAAKADEAPAKKRGVVAAA